VNAEQASNRADAQADPTASSGKADIDPDSLSPREAHAALYRLKALSKGDP
jgi:hypothetical protein